MTPKKRMSGCVIALVVVAAVAVLVVAVGIYVLWRAVSTPEGKRVAKIVGDTAQIMFKAQSAAGASEVRRKGRCEQAYVITGEDMGKLGADFSDAASPTGRALVMCQVTFLMEPPSCEELARTYADTVHPPKRFDVIVKKASGTKTVCQETFERDGTRRE
jgi:hypothetical protein